MRPIMLPNATKVLIAAFAVLLSFADFAEARDHGERHFIRRPHHERQHRERSETLSGVTADHHHWRRPGKNHIVGRTAHRRHFDRRFAHGRRFDRQGVMRQYRGLGRNGWDHSYDDFPSYANGGMYFGGLSAWTDPGNGTYFYSERGGYGYYSGNTDADYRAPRAKIIRVSPSSADGACSWEAGVCVIRR